jgi:hypothetical protein
MLGILGELDAQRSGVKLQHEMVKKIFFVMKPLFLGIKKP